MSIVIVDRVVVYRREFFHHQVNSGGKNASAATHEGYARRHHDAEDVNTRLGHKSTAKSLSR